MGFGKGFQIKSSLFSMRGTFQLQDIKKILMRRLRTVYFAKKSLTRTATT